MGLDMYLFTAPADLVGTRQVDIEVPEGVEFEELAYWRKVWALHSWMYVLYHEKGGTEEFNCTTVRLEPKDFERLQKDLISGQLKKRIEDEHYDPEKIIVGIQEAISAAQNAISNGKACLYEGWY